MEPLPNAGLKRGDLVAGRYEIEAIAGEGGMAIVYSARHLHLDEKYAIKVLRAEFARERSVVHRFMEEARAAAQLRSDHACRVFDVGLLPDGTPYIVMELLPGEDLREYAHRLGSVPMEQAVEFAIQCCEALAEVHAVGLIHRDIKPENLFVTTRSDGWRSVKLLDFGISKILDSETMSTSIRQIASSSNVMGTPQYMAPEEIRSGKDGDARSDLWSLGVVLYEVLAGRCPFPAGTLAEVSKAVIELDPPNLGTLRPDLPPGLVEAVHWCLAKPRELRASSAAELAAQLMQFAPRRARAVVERMQSLARSQGELIQLPPSVFPPSSIPADRVATGVTLVATKAPARNNLLWAGAIVAAFLTAGVVTWVQTSSPPGVAEPAPTQEPQKAAPGPLVATPPDKPSEAPKPSGPPSSEPGPVETAAARPPPDAATPPPPRGRPWRGKTAQPTEQTSKPSSKPGAWDTGPDVGF